MPSLTDATLAQIANDLAHLVDRPDLHVGDRTRPWKVFYGKVWNAC
jgi:hypothetical protein